MPENSSTSNFNTKTFGKLLVIVLFVLLLLPVCRYSGEQYEDAAGKNKINAWSKQRFDDFYTMEKNTLDMVFLGSSHSYCTFDPENIDEALGINSYQLGMPLQHPDMTYYTLLEVLNTQHPKTVAMELYWDVLDDDFDMKQIDTFFQVLGNETTKADIIKNVFPQGEKVKYGIKPIRFQQDFFAYENKMLLDYFENEYKLKRTVTQNAGEEYYRSKGYIYCNYIMTDEEYTKISNSTGLDGKKWRMSGVQKKYIEAIATLCNNNKIELIFVTAPVSNISFGKMKNYDKIHGQIQEMADALDVPYLDFNVVNAEEGLFLDEHFRDGRHLNDNGVKAADAYFADWYEKIR